MKRLDVFIEIDGAEKYVGDIVETSPGEFGFKYDTSYMELDVYPISISLPFTSERYLAEATRNFFEGLLPEGFTRRALANMLHLDENDYISILAELGQECLGAIRIIEDSKENVEAGYKHLSYGEIKALAAEGTVKSAKLVTEAHLSLTGASGKVGLYYDDVTGSWYLPKGTAPSTHIVKQSHVRLKGIVTNEQLCLLTAKKMGIEVPDSFILNTNEGQEDEILFATRRYDRYIDANSKTVSGLRIPYRLHQEDFALALGIASTDKYEKIGDNYLEKAFRLLSAYSSNPIEDQMKLWDIIVFDWLVGNTDNHIKNISLVYDKSMKQIRLAPAYDIISTVIYDSAINMGISVGGKLNVLDIDEECFKIQASKVGLGQRIAINRLNQLKDVFDGAMHDAASELINLGFEDAGKIADRIIGYRRDRE